LLGAILLAGLSVYVWNTILNHPSLHVKPEPVLAVQPVRID
jgi:hypothetical protein